MVTIYHVRDDSEDGFYSDEEEDEEVVGMKWDIGILQCVYERMKDLFDLDDGDEAETTLFVTKFGVIF